MPRIPDDQRRKLEESIRTHDFLHRVLRRIENLHRVVFHGHNLDRQFIRAAANEVLVADLVTRHHGNIDGVYFALRKTEASGRPWDQAIADYAAYVHNYFTTPLGVVIRRDLFGDACHVVPAVPDPAPRPPQKGTAPGATPPPSVALAGS